MEIPVFLPEVPEGFMLHINDTLPTNVPDGAWADYMSNYYPELGSLKLVMVHKLFCNITESTEDIDTLMAVLFRAISQAFDMGVLFVNQMLAEQKSKELIDSE